MRDILTITLFFKLQNAPLQESDQKCSTWLQEYPVTLMQFLLFLYHNQPDFISLSITSEFISGLVATLFPSNNVSTESKVTTPQDEYMVRMFCNYADLVS